ncbi:MAG: hypothetical protein ACP5O8_02185 [Candidatus Aenigmatarchaeota archaeon]
MKGLIYTIISILMVASIIAILTSYMSISYSLRKDTADKIISDQLHYFEKNVEEDIERALRISARRALVAAVDNVTLGGIAFPKGEAINKIFELAQNGTLDGSRNDFMVNNSISYWMEEIEKKANKTFKFNLTTSKIEIKPFDSFNILFRINFTINISDHTETIRIYREGKKEVLISIEGLEDPLAPLYSEGRYRKTIWRCPFESNHVYEVSGVYHFENLANDTENGYFHSSLYGPSFLDRLEGSLIASDFYRNMATQNIGLESFVNIQKIKALGFTPTENKTLVDFLYFNTSAHPDCYYVDNPEVQKWFRIDNSIDDQQRLMKYQLLGNPYLKPC